MFKSRNILIIAAVVTLDLKLCFSACAHAEYEINGQCCPMCAPGSHTIWHCTEDTSTTCMPCPVLTYTDEPNGLIKCLPCTVCDANQGLKLKKACTRSADTVCEPLEGFYCTVKNKGSCTLASEHSKCNPGQYIKQSGTAFMDIICANCTDGTYSNGSLTTCQPHSKCSTEGRKEIKPGTMLADAVCGNLTRVGLIFGVIVGIVALLVAAVGIPLTYMKLKRKTQSSSKRVNCVSQAVPEHNDLSTPCYINREHQTRILTKTYFF
ncbi:tumor necrosis factor receptor superfamily member 14-like isoform X2 [Xyrauchen texanus]|uniref:tumor necrosis factor receptor superfamily member 14-like isoform X2 n=1 Tax=Xyrauchen texanus TaxID=154827 RepID=UPI002241D458|nr:tumor necrosis factor receptor superfamily member 14-like isoform X2 [Xyrauchen texanus]